jgi:hypothetical protein
LTTSLTTLIIPARSSRAAAEATASPSARQELTVSFFVGLILFVVVIGILDARLPWPPGAPASRTP